MFIITNQFRIVSPVLHVKFKEDYTVASSVAARPNLSFCVDVVVVCVYISRLVSVVRVIVRVVVRVANPLVPCMKLLHDGKLRISWFAKVSPPDLVVVAGLGVTVNALFVSSGGAIFGVDAARRRDLVYSAVGLGEEVVTVTRVVIAGAVAVHGAQERICGVRLSLRLRLRLGSWLCCGKYRVASWLYRGKHRLAAGGEGHTAGA